MKKTIVAFACLSLATAAFALDARTHEQSGSIDLMEELVLKPIFGVGEQQEGWTSTMMEERVSEPIQSVFPGEPAKPALERLRAERAPNHN